MSHFVDRVFIVEGLYIYLDLLTYLLIYTETSCILAGQIVYKTKNMTNPVMVFNMNIIL